MYRRFIVLALGLAPACTGPDLGPGDFELPPGAPPAVVTDAAVYTLIRDNWGYRAAAMATYTNRTNRAVYFQRCTRGDATPIYSLRRSGPDSTAATVVTAIWACVGGVPGGRILPGESISTRVDLGSYDSPQAQPPITPAERVGRFRVEFALCVSKVESSGDCVALPQAARESNAFEVRFPAP